MNNYNDSDLLSPNRDLSNSIALLGIYYYYIQEPHRARAFITAANVVSQHSTKITNKNEVKNSRGIGKSTLQLIDGYINNSNSMISRFNILCENVMLKNRHTTVSLFMSIYGVGPVRANALYDLGCQTLESFWLHGHPTNNEKLAIMWCHHINEPISVSEQCEIQTFFENISHIIEIEYNLGCINLVIECGRNNISNVITTIQQHIPSYSLNGENNPSIFIINENENNAVFMFQLMEEYNAHVVQLKMI